MDTLCPLDLECPICLKSFTEPVIASDGNTYDLGCLRPWFTAHSNSPYTKKQISRYVYRNMFVCKLLDLKAPINDTFDMVEDMRWESEAINLVPETLYEGTPYDVCALLSHTVYLEKINTSLQKIVLILLLLLVFSWILFAVKNSLFTYLMSVIILGISIYLGD